MKKTLTTFVILAAVVAIIAFLYPRTPPQALKLYAGAGLRRAVEKLTAAFQAKTGIKIDADYGGSGLVLSRARQDAHADLFMPGDAWYVDRLDALSGHVDRRGNVAYFVPTLIVAKGNPKGIHTLADLARPGLRLGLGKPDTCQIGRVSDKLLTRAGIDTTTLDPQQSLTVNELGVWVKMKTVDAAIVWDAIAANLADDVDIVAIPPEQNQISRVVLATLTTSSHAQAAEQFLDFVQSPQGQTILRQTGFRTTPPPTTRP